jgi:hypothetical protein
VKANYQLAKMQSREKADCSVLAAQFCIGLGYEVAYELLAEAGRAPRRRVPSRIFEKLGLVQRPELSGRTVGKALESMQSGRFVVFIAGHFFAVVDGRVFDSQFTNWGARVKMAYQAPMEDDDFLRRYPYLQKLARLGKLQDVWGNRCENYAAQQRGN